MVTRLFQLSTQSGRRATMSSSMGMAVGGTLYLAVVPFTD
jgi:threonine/homoserine/homoserine lactone efflux protein